MPAHVPLPLPAPVATPPSSSKLATSTNQPSALHPVPPPAAPRLIPVKRTSGFIGCHWHRGAGKWVAQISIACKRTHLGYFSTEIEAARQYDEKAEELGRPTNFPSERAYGSDAANLSPIHNKPNALIVGAIEGYTKGPYKKRQKTATATSSPVLAKAQPLLYRTSAEGGTRMGNIESGALGTNSTAIAALAHAAMTAKSPSPSPQVVGPPAQSRPLYTLPSAAGAPAQPSPR